MLSRAALRTCQQMRPLVVGARGTATGSRDEQNFPRPVRQEPGKVRLGFLPDEWFLFFHKKTGVTGPYMFGTGLVTYLCSKEIFVMEHEYYTGLSILLMMVFVHKKFGPGIAAWMDKNVDDIEASFNKSRTDKRDVLEEAIANEKKEQWRAEGNRDLILAKKENVLLQLEAAYRERIFATYQEVRKRLDYQVETQNVDRRITQKHMVSWIVANVLKSITPDQEKDTLNKCIADLGALAGKQ